MRLGLFIWLHNPYVRPILYIMFMGKIYVISQIYYFVNKITFNYIRIVFRATKMLFEYNIYLPGAYFLSVLYIIIHIIKSYIWHNIELYRFLFMQPNYFIFPRSIFGTEAVNIKNPWVQMQYTFSVPQNSCKSITFNEQSSFIFNITCS